MEQRPETLPLLLSGLTYYGYDFSMFQGPGDTSLGGPIQTLVRDLGVNLKVYPGGKELLYGWGHLATAGLSDPERLPLLNDPDFTKALRQVRSQARFVTLAHPYQEMWGKLDMLLDEGLVDAIELVNAEGLHFRVEAVDDVLFPSPRRDQLMFGDSLQIGLNPIDREDVPCFSFYDLLLTRGADGADERCWIHAVPRIAVESLERNGQYLPASCFGVERLDPRRTRVRLRLPWSALVPMQPLAGYRFGLHLYLFDNDGTGLKSAMAWPWPITDRCWYIPAGADWAQAMLL